MSGEPRAGSRLNLVESRHQAERHDQGVADEPHELVSHVFIQRVIVVAYEIQDCAERLLERAEIGLQRQNPARRSGI
jgi:hypothetical protein